MINLEAGTVLKGKYEVGEKKGKGSLNEDIYHGRHQQLEREIIIRVMPADASIDDEVTQRFIQGLRLSATMQHPNMVSVLDAGEEAGMMYFVTNYEKGFYLNDYLEQRGNLDEKESIRLVKGLADALEYAWAEKHIIHRNICPNTILIAKGNISMLTDFGLAKSLESDTKLTMKGFAVGDPQYMSPEQASGDDEIDYHSDIYCLGLVFYQLLAGHPPFHDKSQIELMTDQIQNPHKPIQGANENVTDACSAVIDKMLEKNVEDRYDSWDDVVADLDAILNENPPAALKKGASKSVIEKVRRDTEKKIAKKHNKAMTEVSRKLAAESKRKLKRNMIILAIIANLIILAAFVWYMKWKHEKAMNKNNNDPSPSSQTE